jgi:hypothetical protein
VTQETTLCFWKTGTITIYDFAVLVGGKYLSQYGGNTLEELQRDDPEIKLVKYSEFAAAHDENASTPVSEITSERYNDMLETLPPMKWRSAGNSESFMFPEYYSGRVTSIFVMYGGLEPRYFTFRGIDTLTAAEIENKIKLYISQ